MKTMNLYANEVNVSENKVFRGGYYEDNGTLNGVYSDGLLKYVFLIVEHLEGRVKLVGDTDFEESSLLPVIHTQENVNSKISIYRKNEAEDLSRVVIRNVPEDLYDCVQKLIPQLFTRSYGNSSKIINMAIILGNKMRSGVTRVSEDSREYAERVLRDGIVSPLYSEVMEVKEDVRGIKEGLGEVLAWINAQVSYAVNKSKKTSNKSFKKPSKLDKATKVLDELKKCNESTFTRRDFKRELIRLFSQGDDRTVNSDLETLLAAGLIKEERLVGYKGTMKYSFTDNELYDEYNGPGAMRSFIESFKDDFKARSQVTKNEVEDFIQRVTDLYDFKSVTRRLDALLTSGYIMPFGESKVIFDVNL